MNVQRSTTSSRSVFIDNRWQPAASEAEIRVVVPAEGFATVPHDMSKHD